MKEAKRLTKADVAECMSKGDTCEVVLVEELDHCIPLFKIGRTRFMAFHNLFADDKVAVEMDGKAHYIPMEKLVPLKAFYS